MDGKHHAQPGFGGRAINNDLDLDFYSSDDANPRAKGKTPANKKKEKESKSKKKKQKSEKGHLQVPMKKEKSQPTEGKAEMGEQLDKLYGPADGQIKKLLTRKIVDRL